MRTECNYLINSLCICNIRRFYWLRELYEADSHKPAIYGTGRVWANAWDVFRRAPSRGGRGCRAAVDIVVCFRWGGFFFSSNAHGLLQVWGRLASFNSLLVSKVGCWVRYRATEEKDQVSNWSQKYKVHLDILLPSKCSFMFVYSRKHKVNLNLLLPSKSPLYLRLVVNIEHMWTCCCHLNVTYICDQTGTCYPYRGSWRCLFSPALTVSSSTVSPSCWSTRRTVSPARALKSLLLSWWTCPTRSINQSIEQSTIQSNSQSIEKSTIMGQSLQ